MLTDNKRLDEIRAIIRARTGKPKTCRAALIILRGCPTGATERALEVNGVTLAALDELVRLGLACCTIDTLTNGMQIPRYTITPVGRGTLEGGR
jgi:hypothetical protein